MANAIIIYNLETKKGGGGKRCVIVSSSMIQCICSRH